MDENRSSGIQHTIVSQTKAVKRRYPNPMANINTQENSIRKMVLPISRSVSQNYKKSGSDFGDEIDMDEMRKMPKNKNVKAPIIRSRGNVDVNEALSLQTETNNLLKHLISQQNKQIGLLTQLLDK